MLSKLNELLKNFKLNEHFCLPPKGIISILEKKDKGEGKKKSHNTSLPTVRDRMNVFAHPSFVLLRCGQRGYYSNLKRLTEIQTC